MSDSSQAERDNLAAWRNRLGPVGYAYEVWSKRRYQEFFGVDRGQEKDFEWLAKWEKSLKVSVLRAPSHGKLTQVDQAYGMLITPDVDYLGKDRVDLLVEGNDDLGRAFALTLRYYINVVGREYGLRLNATKYPDYKDLCGTVRHLWRISEVEQSQNLFATWQKNAELSSLLASASLTLSGFFNLDGSAVGNTVSVSQF